MGETTCRWPDCTNPGDWLVEGGYLMCDQHAHVRRSPDGSWVTDRHTRPEGHDHDN